MNEKVYKTMSHAGVSSLVLGIVMLTAGLAAGILMIINGAKLMKRKFEITI